MADVAALVLSAGLSSRMAAFKPLLDLGGQSTLARVVSMFRAAGIDDIRVVTGHRASEVEAEARALGARPVGNPDFRDGMFSSVLAGVRALQPGQAFCVLPVDIPLVRPGTVRQLLGRHAEEPGAILYPAYYGERGHPPLLPPDMRGEILRWDGRGGLAGLLAEHERRAVNVSVDVPVADSHILRDMDTDADAKTMLARLPHLDYPDREECEVLLGLQPNVTDMGLRHSRAVERFARAMAQALIQAEHQPPPDPELVTAAALLHDIAKGSPGHEAKGGRLLDNLGYPRVARIVEAHRDIDLPPGAPITEREIVYLADKLAQGPHLVTVEERFTAKIRLHGHKPGAEEAIRGRMNRAIIMRQRMERAMSRTLEDLLGPARDAPLA